MVQANHLRNVITTLIKKEQQQPLIKCLPSASTMTILDELSDLVFTNAPWDNTIIASIFSYEETEAEMC